MRGTVNKVMLIGHTGDDIKMIYFEGGGVIGRFPLATNDEYTNKSTGERVSNTEWHNVVVRNKAAEICEKYLRKGDKIYVEGRLKTRKWRDDQGNDRYSTEVQCTDFTFLTPKGGDHMQNQPAPQAKPDTPPAPAHTENNHAGNPEKNAAPDSAEADDDLPF